MELKNIINAALNQSMSYAEYMELMESLTLTGKASGPKQTEALVNYTKLNKQRMTRLVKTISLDDAARKKVAKVNAPQTWLIITESWCGDAAQSLPLIEKLAAANELINTRYVLRDENLELMDQFLFRGGRSIPKLIMLDDSFEVIDTWGPRPQAAQMLFDNWKKEETPRPYSEFSVELQKWYLQDKGQSTFEEISEKLVDCCV
ncbi:thioredoxin family protein [Marinoscillum furvescens]|uniref:Thiol-disulfide isomerase/thioredoxin n=1 Tax=Marinoscillum furvescens DSM 4134 TaxID=1122208 RepID=A0A3D9L2E6_MARFU|nr:thioredoxin family protein [Marinoscillum furvescens]RED98911.1 thiol-disulfide isomerase/thioredoxin [Marinoscillum furvescens DSM 4134]